MRQRSKAKPATEGEMPELKLLAFSELVSKPVSVVFVCVEPVLGGEGLAFVFGPDFLAFGPRKALDFIVFSRKNAKLFKTGNGNTCEF